MAIPQTKAQTLPYVQGSLFEDNYLIRTLGALATSADIALTELVANAWDAGATKVDITIPEDRGQKIIIQDNGVGLTKDQFHYRWMRLGYDRLKHQGRKVLFPAGVKGNRLAYGRNGVGRHGLLCFDNEYTVVTTCEGKKSTFVITTLSNEEPFVIKEEFFGKTNRHGTRLEVVVNRNLPNPKRILDIISARFLHDPTFVVSINSENVPLQKLQGLVNSQTIYVKDVTMQVHFIDSQRTARSTLYQGIAFWQGGRLVGEPSWVLGYNAVIDGRTKYAKRYTVVVETDDLAEYILEDWTGFRRVQPMNDIYEAIEEYINAQFKLIAKENIQETKEQIKTEFAQDYNDLSALAKFDISEAIESISLNHPTARQESVSIAVEAIINLEKTRTGKELLSKLAKFNDDDVEGLNELLTKWTARDALVVLDEIDGRISIIEALRKLSNDKDIDELQILHPLMTGARWLFGPEFESAEFASNQQLQNAVEKVFKTKIQTGVFNNHKKRPDIVILSESTVSVTGTEVFEPGATLATVNRLLILELKRGGFSLTRKERDQATGYVEDFMTCGNLIGSPHIDAFVIGKQFSEKVQPSFSLSDSNNVQKGQIRIATYAQIVDTAEKRLFGLRQKLSERYDDVPGMDLAKKHLQQSKLELT